MPVLENTGEHGGRIAEECHLYVTVPMLDLNNMVVLHGCSEASNRARGTRQEDGQKTDWNVLRHSEDRGNPGANVLCRSWQCPTFFPLSP